MSKGHVEAVEVDDAVGVIDLVLSSGAFAKGLLPTWERRAFMASC